MEKHNQAFKAVTRIVLNNWHYIDAKVLELNESINFFTGHSGSGKSTVIDALQIVLYANTDGRGFFNKAAADDSDRSLIEYLRGMINIGENNQARYKRNRNFSTTIALELTQTASGEKECVGVVFDVETATNEITRLFFRHPGGLPQHFYRVGGQMSLDVDAQPAGAAEALSVSTAASDGSAAAPSGSAVAPDGSAAAPDAQWADSSEKTGERPLSVKKNTGEVRAMSTAELKAWMSRSFAKEDWFATANNERFRRVLYDVYLGGLDMEKFPRLFKRAIPFRMNIRLEDFVKEYICMEQDIHIEDMQESVILYGRMRQRIEETAEEIGQLERIRDSFAAVQEQESLLGSLKYRAERLSLMQLEEQISLLEARMETGKQDRKTLEGALEGLNGQKEACAGEREEINRELLQSGYGELEAKRRDLAENLELLLRSERKKNAVCEGLAAWEEEESISNQALWDIDAFRKGEITGEVLLRLKKELKQLRDEAERQRQEAASEKRGLQKEASLLERDLKELQMGKKAYPKALEEARLQIQKGLYESTGKNIPVRVLADLLDIRDEKWRNALEGYLGWNKLTLMVEPAFAARAMELYEKLDAARFSHVALADTGKLSEQTFEARPGSLAEEVECREKYVKNHVNFLLGNVIKCESMEQLRQCRVGVTADCLLYQSFQLRRLNPEQYTKRAFIGEKSLRRRQKELSEQLFDLRKALEERQEEADQAARLLGLEALAEPAEVYLELFADVQEKRRKEEQLARLDQKLSEVGEGAVEALKERLVQVDERQKALEKEIDAVKLKIHDQNRRMEKDAQEHLEKNELLLSGQKSLVSSRAWEEAFDAWFSELKKPSFEALLGQTGEERENALRLLEERKSTLVDTRSDYLRKHPGRDFSASAPDNGDYQELLDSLSCERIQEYERIAEKQAKIAVEHFREDFIYKIRSAIKEAFLRRDELNRIIRSLNFGKDRYQFRISRNRGPDGAYYDMFMDESLEIDPSALSGSMDRQMDLFSMDHEKKYGMLMNDLIRMFLPPQSADARQQEEAKRNMEKYSDYRTYLSFEMEQIVEGDDRLVIDLSKMIRKNSGGEGQNPLYVALLASFAQAYHISASPAGARRPTIRLVVLDEAFSKMDAEKVASCIELIRGLGFQAIISATNDKIQNYLENVDKTFVFANPNKKSISIQEFEKKDYGQLEGE